MLLQLANRVALPHPQLLKVSTTPKVCIISTPPTSITHLTVQPSMCCIPPGESVDVLSLLTNYILAISKRLCSHWSPENRNPTTSCHIHARPNLAITPFWASAGGGVPKCSANQCRGDSYRLLVLGVFNDECGDVEDSKPTNISLNFIIN